MNSYIQSWGGGGGDVMCLCVCVGSGWEEKFNFVT